MVGRSQMCRLSAMILGSMAIGVLCTIVVYELGVDWGAAKRHAKYYSAARPHYSSPASLIRDYFIAALEENGESADQGVILMEDVFTIVLLHGRQHVLEGIRRTPGRARENAVTLLTHLAAWGEQYHGSELERHRARALGKDADWILDKLEERVAPAPLQKQKQQTSRGK